MPRLKADLRQSDPGQQRPGHEPRPSGGFATIAKPPLEPAQTRTIDGTARFHVLSSSV
jgi:hypothetical protein